MNSLYKHLQCLPLAPLGDNGMINVITCRSAHHDTSEIDTWLMSCRVLSRRVEYGAARNYARER